VKRRGRKERKKEHKREGGDIGANEWPRDNCGADGFLEIIYYSGNDGKRGRTESEEIGGGGILGCTNRKGSELLVMEKISEHGALPEKRVWQR